MPSGIHLELQLMDPDSRALFRLFQHPGMHWHPPNPSYRNLRVDPPPGHKAEFAVMYLADTLPTVAIECNVLQWTHTRGWECDELAAARYQVARYRFRRPAIFIPIDGRNRETFGLSPATISPFGDYLPYQELALELYRRFGQVIHGLCWDSYHRNQTGRVFALWHDHKSTVGLKCFPPDPPFDVLANDSEWVTFLANNAIQSIA